MTTENKTQPKVRTVLKHYMPFVRKYWTQHVVLLAAFGFASLVVSVAEPLIIKGIIDATVLDPTEARPVLVQLLFALAGTVVLYNVLFRLADYVALNVQSTILKELHDYAMDGLQAKSYTFFANAFSGALVAKTKRFVMAFETLQDTIIFQVWMGSIMLVSSIVVLWLHSVPLALVFLGWLLLYIVLVRFMVRWQIPKSLSAAEADTKTTAHFSDILTNILTVKMFGASPREKRSFEETTRAQETSRTAAWMQQSFWNNLFQGTFILVFQILILSTTVWFWLEGKVGAGVIVLVQLYVLKVFDVVWQISRNTVRVSAALSDAYEMAAILDQPVTLRDPVDPEVVRAHAGRVSFTGVSHVYEGNSDCTLDGLQLDIAPGERVALVGHSGAGKTTVVKLLLRFLDIDKGSITIDGQDVRAVTQDDLRKHIAYVPQEPILFHRTLRENIAYGKPEATDAEVEEAAQRAHAHDFIARLPLGYDTLVGERGVKLSGGERQRVAIARAMLKDAPIVVLDEATSSLDSVSEQLIQQAFDELISGRTTIVIAHRLSTIQHMDRIVVLEAGKVAEQGTHTALLEHDGIYANLWHSQVGGFLSE